MAKGGAENTLYASVSQEELEFGDSSGERSIGRLFSRGPDAGDRRGLLKKLLVAAFVLAPYVLLLAVIVGVSPYNTTANSAAVTALVNGSKVELEQVCASQRLAKLEMKRNVYYDSSLVTRPQRYAAVQQKGATLWFTGLSGSGKSTVGRALEKELLRRRVHVYRLDGDNVQNPFAASVKWLRCLQKPA